MTPPRSRHGWRSKGKATTAASVARVFRETERQAFARTPIPPRTAEELERDRAADAEVSDAIEAALRLLPGRRQ